MELELGSRIRFGHCGQQERNSTDHKGLDESCSR